MLRLRPGPVGCVPAFPGGESPTLELVLPQESGGHPRAVLFITVGEDGCTLGGCGVSGGPRAKVSDAFLPSPARPQGRCIGTTMEATLMNTWETKGCLHERESPFAQHQV